VQRLSEREPEPEHDDEHEQPDQEAEERAPLTLASRRSRTWVRAHGLPCRVR